MADQATGIELNAKLSIFFILVGIQPLVVDVNGTETKGRWAVQFLNVGPGNHRVTVSWKFYWFIPVQKATLDVTVAPGQVVKLRYKVRWFVFMPGKLSIEAG